MLSSDCIILLILLSGACPVAAIAVPGVVTPCIWAICTGAGCVLCTNNVPAAVDNINERVIHKTNWVRPTMPMPKILPIIS